MERCRLSDDPAVRPEWEIAGKMAEGRSFLGSAAVEGKVFIMGGLISAARDNRYHATAKVNE